MKSFKNLFIIDDEAETKQETPQHTDQPLTFPTSSSNSNTATAAKPKPTSTNTTQSIPPECGPHMDNIMKMYEEGFDNLNQPGVEFFEFFEAVIDADGINNPQAYKMALKMLSGMNSSLNKESLLSQSQFYIDELNKVHSGYDITGNKKKEELIGDKNAEASSLSSDIQNLRQQVESIKNEISSKEELLSQIDTKYQPQLNEVDCKLMANNEAKNRILQKIQNVVQGVKNYL